MCQIFPFVLCKNTPLKTPVNSLINYKCFESNDMTRRLNLKMFEDRCLEVSYLQTDLI